MHYNMILASLHEHSLYDAHDLADFRPPYKLRTVLPTNTLYGDITPDTVSALGRCIKSAEAIIDTFLNLTIETLRNVPVIMYAIIAYAVIILTKFDVSAQGLLDTIEPLRELKDLSGASEVGQGAFKQAQSTYQSADSWHDAASCSNPAFAPDSRSNGTQTTPGFSLFGSITDFEVTMQQ